MLDAVFSVGGARYSQYTDSDEIAGTKEQLQAFGIGVGLAFPGEPGAPRWSLRTTDPRGFPVFISNRYLTDGKFSARITFPHWPKAPDFDQPEEVFPGVELRRHPFSDSYVGHVEALTDAGLLRSDQLPGAPGMRKTRVTIFADGTLPTGAPTANHRQSHEPGARTIQRVSASVYRVSVVVPTATTKRRQLEQQRAHREWLQQAGNLPRPEPLRPRIASTVLRLQDTRPRAQQDSMTRLAALQGFLAAPDGGGARVIPFSRPMSGRSNAMEVTHG